jgi:hypothetical protein
MSLSLSLSSSSTSSSSSSSPTSPTTPTTPTTHFSQGAVLSYMNDEIVFIQQIHIANKETLLARKIVDSRLIHSIDNLKEVLVLQLVSKLPVVMRYTLFLSIDRLMDYLFLATQPDWPVDRDVEKEISVLEQFKANFTNHLQQIIQFVGDKAITKTAPAPSPSPTQGEYKSLLHLLNASVSSFNTMPRMNSVADIARFIQFISYVCNDYTDLKDDLII